MTPRAIFRLNQKLPGKIVKGNKSTTGNQPPRNKTETKLLINNMLAYSPKKNKAKVIAEYSTLYPETNSASASGKSKGCRFVSASIEIQNIINIGSNGNINHTLF